MPGKRYTATWGEYYKPPIPYLSKLLVNMRKEKDIQGYV